MRLIDADALVIHKFPEEQCNGFGEGVAFRVGWNEAIDAISGNEPTISKWIPCSERLPSVGRDVLLSTKDWTSEGIRKANGTWFQFRWEALVKADEVIAWMPLPEPYKGGESE